MLGQLNNTTYKEEKRNFVQKDGDSIMLILPISNILSVPKIFENCLAMYYSKGFQIFCKNKIKTTQLPQFYFSVGIGDITTEEKNNADVANGSSISLAKEGIDLIKKMIKTKDFSQYNFKSTPFKLYINASIIDRELANECTALFYLLYEKILTTKIQKIIYGIILDNPNIKLVDVGKKLFTYFDIKSYGINYKDSKKRAQISSRVSIIKKRIEGEPIKLTTKAILSTLRRFTVEREIK